MSESVIATPFVRLASKMRYESIAGSSDKILVLQTGQS